MILKISFGIAFITELTSLKVTVPKKHEQAFSLFALPKFPHFFFFLLSLRYDFFSTMFFILVAIKTVFFSRTTRNIPSNLSGLEISFLLFFIGLKI